MGTRTRPAAVRILCAFALLAAHAAPLPAQSANPFASGGPPTFKDAKTFFQTNAAYDPKLAFATDGVVVHGHNIHGAALETLIGSWKAANYPTGKMFFADSDGGMDYATGGWDGQSRPGDIETDRKGNPLLCGGTRPYILPTADWTKYLREIATNAVNAGADAILPEEPLGHSFSGYEPAFREAWEKRYETPWQPESASPEARYLTGQLKAELYTALEQNLADLTAERAGADGRPVSFLLPVHSIYSCMASRLVAPLGGIPDMKNVDGIVGQVWTGPVIWTLKQYDSQDESIFASAYLLYDYFNELTRGTGKKCYFLTDPVEDDPKHTWVEFAQYWRECVAAQMFFPETAAYEVMPWPERIFLPGHETGGGSPAPDPYQIQILAAMQAMQEMPLGGEWLKANADGDLDRAEKRARVGVAVGDHLTWQADDRRRMQSIYALMIPLAQEGIPVSTFVAERAEDAKYLKSFDMIVLSAANWRPNASAPNEALAKWVRGGGRLVIVGDDESLAWPNLWWSKEGFASSTAHLLHALDAPGGEGIHQVGAGHVTRSLLPVNLFSDGGDGAASCVGLLRETAEGTGLKGLEAAPWILRRGPYYAVKAARQPVRLKGTYVDIFSPELELAVDPEVTAGASCLFKSAEPAEGVARIPRAVHATHRLVGESFDGNALNLILKAPEGTPGCVLIDLAGRKPAALEATTQNGMAAPLAPVPMGRYLLLKTVNDASGITIRLVFS